MKQQEINELNKRFENASPQEIIQFFITKYGERIALASSFGAEDQVLTDMIAKTDKSTAIFTLDTGRLFPETYDLIQRTRTLYKIPVHIYFPDAAQVEKMVNKKGINLFYKSIENRKLCCHVRKIEPLKRALHSLDAWFCGLRRDQSVTRNDTQVVEWDDNNNLLKINPLISWTEASIWDYIKKNKTPYNPLHDKNFRSIGCQPCTRAIEEGEDIRAGRWWWENPEQKECGLHKSKR